MSFKRLLSFLLGQESADSSRSKKPSKEDTMTFDWVHPAFSQINQQDDIYENASIFAGQPVKDYNPKQPCEDGVLYRFRSDWDNPVLVPNLEHYLSTPAAATAKGLVIGAWHDDDSTTSSEDIVAKLVQVKDQLPELRALYLGDITSEENEMSWIVQSDLSPLLQAFPKLEILRTRGGEDLALNQPEHPTLRALAMESGGMDGSVVRSLAKSKFPKLEYLELWLGTDEYGGSVTPQDLAPLFSGELFPNLKYLGLRNSDTADQVATAIVGSPILKRIEVLDLSLGTLSEVGGRDLLKLQSPTLKHLILHHHYMGPELCRKLEALPFTVVTANPSDMEQEDDGYRFVAVGE